MTLLKDDELEPLVTGDNPIVVDLPAPPAQPAPPRSDEPPNPWYGPKSALQASSVDLHVGAILVPGANENEPGSVDHPKADLALKSGHTVVITTQEKLRLPKHIAAFGFPPASLSFRGLLMTNPGHVDPGYEGLLRFTVINMGKEDVSLRVGDPIVTLLFFHLGGDAHAGYAERRVLTAPVGGPKQSEVDRLSLDFMDIDSRADAAARKAVASAEYRAKLWGVFVPIIGAIATISAAFLVAFVGLWQPLNTVRTDLDEVREILEIKESRSRLDKLDELEELNIRIEELAEKFQAKSAPKAGGENP